MVRAVILREIRCKNSSEIIPGESAQLKCNVSSIFDKCNY